MADVILPDNVFENMQHAQEAAEKMNAAVDDFNKKIDEKFKGKDKNEDAKLKQQVKPILTADEKRRYRNIGNAFFEGAKNQIIDIFKQIEKNKKKNIFKRAAGAVAEKIQSIKDAVEEHKTAGKILLAIAAIGGIYLLFKDWFDENMPKIWDKMKEAVSSFANSAIDFGKEIANAVANTDLFTSIKNFVERVGDSISGFFKTIGLKLLGLFNDSSTALRPAPGIESAVDEEKARQAELYQNAAIIGVSNVSTQFQKKSEELLNLTAQYDEVVRQQKEGIKQVVVGNKLVPIADRIYDLSREIGELRQEQMQDFDAMREHSSRFLAEADAFAKSKEIQEILNNSNLSEDEKKRQIKDFIKNNSGIIDNLVRENKPLNSGVKTAMTAAGLLATPAMAPLGLATATGLTPAFMDKMNDWITGGDSRIGRGVSNNPEEVAEGVATHILNEGKAAQKQTESTLNEQYTKQLEDNKERLQNANYAKLTHVSVITSLDEFVNNFFTKTFPTFSKGFLDSINTITSSFTDVASIVPHINNLYEQVKLTYQKVDEYGNKISESVVNKSEEIKSFITDSYINKINGFLDNIVKYEKDQIDCLNEQLNVLKQTTLLLAKADIGNGKNVTIVQNQPSSENSVNAFDMPEPDNQHTATAMRFVGDLSM